MQDTDCEFKLYGVQSVGNDGKYLACKNYFEKAEALVNIGINGYDALGCEITTDFSIVNYQYDCTNPTAPVCSTNNQGNRFFLKCLGEKTEVAGPHTFYTLKDVLKRHNLTGKRIAMKIDCEGCEWTTFKNFPLDQL